MEDLRTELHNAYVSAKAPGWYAGEGEPVQAETYEEAKRFLAALPDSFKPTDILPDPHGDLTFEWSANRGRVMLVSFDGKKRAIFAVRFSDEEKASGQAPFLNQIPTVVSYFLGRFLSLDERTQQ